MKMGADRLCIQLLRLAIPALACGLTACLNARQVPGPSQYTELPPGCDIAWSMTTGPHPGSMTCSAPSAEIQAAWQAAIAKCGGRVLRLTAAKGDLASHYKCEARTAR